MRAVFCKTCTDYCISRTVRGASGGRRTYKEALQPPAPQQLLVLFLLAPRPPRPFTDHKAMSGEAGMSFSGTSTAASVHRGAAEVPRGTGARATGEEDEVVSRLALAMGVSRLATISGPSD